MIKYIARKKFNYLRISTIMLYNMINPPKPLNDTRKKVAAISKHAYVFYRVKILYIFEIRVTLEILYEAHLYLLRTRIYQ